ncbi:MAG: type II secretion system F family protein, partial [Firmicutes bacterium]|nr:type II secretion system F family protein [Bacillota bacterium]
MRMGILVIGSLVVGASLLFWVGWEQRKREWTRLFQTAIRGDADGVFRRQPRRTYRQRLIEAATDMGQPELATVWLRTAQLAGALTLSFALLFRAPLFVLFLPFIAVAPLVLAREWRLRYRRQMARQTRQAQILLAFLMRAGAQMEDALAILAEQMEAPFCDRMREVEAKKRYATLSGAMESLAQATGVSVLADFAVLIAESQRYGTPMAEATMRSLTLETKLRDARAARRYGEVQLQLSMFATFFIAFPGFGFVLYALLAYALSLFQG